MTYRSKTCSQAAWIALVVSVSTGGALGYAVEKLNNDRFPWLIFLCYVISWEMAFVAGLLLGRNSGARET